MGYLIRFAPRSRSPMFQLSKLNIQQFCLFSCFLVIFACSNQPVKEAETTSMQEDTSSQNNPVPVPVADTVYHIDTQKTYIYLTFDDGPQHGTMNCFKICQQEGVKASFFMIGAHQHMKSDGKQIVATIRNNYPQTLLANHKL